MDAGGVVELYLNPNCYVVAAPFILEFDTQLVCRQNKNVLYLSRGMFIASDDGSSPSPLMVIRLKYFSMQPKLFTSKLIVKNAVATNL